LCSNSMKCDAMLNLRPWAFMTEDDNLESSIVILGSVWKSVFLAFGSNCTTQTVGTQKFCLDAVHKCDMEILQKFLDYKRGSY
jgi:hypothetical protein